jgi:hypothetical protein
MSTKLTRRAALGSTASLIAVAATTSTSIAASADAELLALEPAIQEARRLEEAAYKIYSAVEDRYLTWCRALPELECEETVKVTHASRIEGKIEFCSEPLPDAIARNKVRQEEREKLQQDMKASLGVDASEETYYAQQDVVIALVKQAAAMPARTPAGFVFKALLSVQDDEPMEGCPVAASLVDDVLTIFGKGDAA